MNGWRTMPGAAGRGVTSQAWFDREQARIFSRTWAFAGLAQDVGGAGPVRRGAGRPEQHLHRDGPGPAPRAFHNVCRHRGTQLLCAVGKAQNAITGPYHDWTYDVEGRPISVPNRETEFPASTRRASG